MKIWKANIPMLAAFVLPLPDGARVLTVQTQDNKPVIWFSFDSSQELVLIARRFHLLTTGNEHPSLYSALRYVGTFQTTDAAGQVFVGHLYEEAVG